MSSFSSALSGLRTHQSWIELIGNNLANANTPGFKGSRAVFSDLFSLTMRPGTAPSSNLGGRNPLQVGLGVQLSGSDMRFAQGTLQTTGRTFDLALVGNGMFTLAAGSETLYSRVGTFGLDGTGTLVDLSSGARVLNPSGQNIRIDPTMVTPPSGTTEIGFAGNLPANVTGPLAEVMTSSNEMAEGTQASLTGSLAGPFNLTAGQSFSFELSIDGAAPQMVTIAGNGVTTATEVAQAINDQTDDVTATVGAGGELVLTSDSKGDDSTIALTAGPSGSDLQAILGLGASAQGTQMQATLTSDLNALVSNEVPYANGDTIQVSGTNADGSVVNASFVYGVDGTTVGDLTTFLDGAFDDASAEFNATTGRIELTADETGEASLALAITDGSGQAGSTNWATNFFQITTDGTGPDTVTSSIEVFDSSGIAHVLTFDYERQDDGLWTATASLPSDSGTVTSGPITGIRFNPDGSLLSPASATIELDFAGLPTQQVTLGLGTPGSFTGITQFGSSPTLVADSQDGFGAGELANIAVNQDGTIEGFFTNGQTEVLGQVGISTFANPGGLEKVGESFFRATTNSGARVLGAGGANGAGSVVGGAIEGSNIDTAEEFVNLIEAQRGFQANARVITVQDEVLAEVVNIV